MEQVLQILSAVRPDVDFETETALIDDGVLDSFDIVAIVGDLNDAFGIEITVEELEPENFNSAEAIYALVQKLLEE
ncbi:MAG: acyl carrier protein [Acutalibacter sp.]|nr:acyl carrier protein [Acutalibacter sp.]